MIKSAVPVGTLAELKARGWHPSEYGSCSQPEKDGSNVGCFAWDLCQKSRLGAANCALVDHQSIAGQGPETVPYEFVKHESQGGAMRQDSAPCYGALKIQKMIEGSQGIFRILEDEKGDFVDSVTVTERWRIGKIKLKEWEDEHPGEKAPDYLIQGAHNPNHPDQRVFDSVIVERAVTKFPRPSQNTKLVKSLLASKIREQEINKRKQRRLDEKLNISPEDVKVVGKSK